VTTTVKSAATTMESTFVKSATSEAVAKPAMPTESKTAEPATVVGRSMATPIVVGATRSCRHKSRNCNRGGDDV